MVEREGGNPFAYPIPASRAAVTTVTTKKPMAVPANTRKPVAPTKARRPCDNLPGGCDPSKPKQKTVAKKPTASQALQAELEESQKAIKELQLALDAEKLAREKSEAARQDCETARSKQDLKSSRPPSRDFNLNTRPDLNHRRKTNAIQLGGKKGFEEMLKQERSACGFSKQLSSSCKEYIFSALKDRDENSCRKELRKLLKRMNSCKMKRIDGSTTIDMLFK